MAPALHDSNAVSPTTPAMSQWFVPFSIRKFPDNSPKNVALPDGSLPIAAGWTSSFPQTIAHAPGNTFNISIPSMLEQLPDQPNFEISGKIPPQATLFIPSHNRSAFVEAALRSALNQTGIVLEILILDDASENDAPRLIIETLQRHTRHPHTVKFWQGQNRRGNNATATLVNRASCDFCIAQHDDDISEPHRARRLYETHLETGATVVSSATTIISTSDREEPDQDPAPNPSHGFIPVENLIYSEKNSSFIRGAQLGFDRTALKAFPPLDTDYLTYGHDSLTSFRGSLLGGFYLLPERLLRYRNHQGQWVKKQADHQSADTARPTNLTIFLALSFAMESDLDSISPSALKIGAQDIAALRNSIHTYRQSLLTRYVRAYENLYRKGYRSLWIEQRVFDQIQLEYAEARFWSRGYWRKLGFWARCLKDRFRQ